MNKKWFDVFMIVICLVVALNWAIDSNQRNRIEALELGLAETKLRVETVNLELWTGVGELCDDLLVIARGLKRTSPPHLDTLPAIDTGKVF